LANEVGVPAKLYKYRRFGLATLRCLTEAEVFYAKPRSFNDPLDSDPTIDIDIDRASLEKLLFRLLTRTLVREAAAQKIGYRRYLSTEYGDYEKDPKVEDYLKRMLAQDLKDEVDDELGDTGVLSLSATWKSALMWSH
jgi:hypothetical protein